MDRILAIALVLGGCTYAYDDEDVEGEEEAYLDPGVEPGNEKADGASTVKGVVSATCSTVPVRGLSMQIADELRCMSPTLLVAFEPTERIRFSSTAVLPYLGAETIADLEAAAETNGSVTVNSGLRSVAQQYLLHAWYKQGRCGIRVAAQPGRSNHETGRALDLANSAEARGDMRNTGFSTLSNDPPHFDHLQSPDLRSMNVEAFQRLWNRNNPDDRIDEDGVYGPNTADRIMQSPPRGFPIGASCE